MKPKSLHKQEPLMLNDARLCTSSATHPESFPYMPRTDSQNFLNIWFLTVETKKCCDKKDICARKSQNVFYYGFWYRLR